MKPSADRNVGLLTRPAFTTASGPGGWAPNPVSTPLEQDGNAAATDRQITLHLKPLFDRDPALLSSLLEDADDSQPAVCAATRVAAVREAPAARRAPADLQHRAAGGTEGERK